MAGRKSNRWWPKLRDAVQGWRSAWATEVNLRVHAVVAVLVSGAAMLSRCEAWEWCAIMLAFGLVISMELMNTAVERIFHALDEPQQQRVRGCLDVAAAAVLFSALMAVVVGLVIFAPKLWVLVR